MPANFEFHARGKGGAEVGQTGKSKAGENHSGAAGGTQASAHGWSARGTSAGLPSIICREEKIIPSAGGQGGEGGVLSGFGGLGERGRFSPPPI